MRPAGGLHGCQVAATARMWRWAGLGAAAALTLTLYIPGAVLSPPAGAAVCHPACSDPFPDPDVYVADSGSASVTVIDAASDAVVATVPVGSDPSGVAVDPVTGDVYVADTDSDSVSVISASTDKVRATVQLPVGSAPTGLASTPNGSTVYVADSGTGEVSVIATSTETVTSSVTVGSSPGAVAVAARGRQRVRDQRALRHGERHQHGEREGHQDDRRRLFPVHDRGQPCRQLRVRDQPVR